MPAVPTQGSKNGVTSVPHRRPRATRSTPAEHLEVLIREALRTLLERLLAAHE